MSPKLNIGGIIGAVLATAITAPFVFWLEKVSTGIGPITLVVIALISGAFMGNFLWQQLFKSNDEK